MSSQAESGRGSRRKKLGGALGAAASVATILTLFLTIGQNHSSPGGSSGGSPGGSSGGSPGGTTQTQAAYPVNIQTNWLNSCEVDSTVATCQCGLTWFEQNVPLQQFEQDQAEFNQGTEPTDLVEARQACGSN
jgi:hypothetical protein